MTINEWVEKCAEPLSIGRQDMNGEELFIGDDVIFHKVKFVRFDSKEEAEEYGYDTEWHYSEWYPTSKVTRMRGTIVFDMDYGWDIEGRSSSPHRFDEVDGKLVNIVRGEK